MRKGLKTRGILAIGMILSSACLSLAHASAFQLNPKAEAAKRTKEISRPLKLTEPQTAKVSEIFLVFFTKMNETRAANLPGEQLKKEIQKHVKERESSLKNALNAGQWEKLLEQRKKEQEYQKRLRESQ